MRAHTIRGMAVVTLMVGLFCAQAARAQRQDPPDQPDQQEQQPHQRGPSTAEERTRAVKIAHALESDPLAKDAKDNREWMIQWIVDIPDITVTVCDEYFGASSKTVKGHERDIINQMIISSAAYMIEHPDKVKDEQAIATAGLLGSLKTYQAILKQDPDARWPYFDKIVQMRDQGKLDDFVSDTRRKCAQEEEQPDPDTIRAMR
jgi:hypothetical protein